MPNVEDTWIRECISEALPYLVVVCYLVVLTVLIIRVLRNNQTPEERRSKGERFILVLILGFVIGGVLILFMSLLRGYGLIRF